MRQCLVLYSINFFSHLPGSKSIIHYQKNVEQNEENTQTRIRCVVEDVGEGFSVKGVVGTGLTSGRGRWGEGGGPTDWAAAAEYFQLILSVSIMALLAVRCGQQQVHLTQQLPRPRLLALASTRSNQELDQVPSDTQTRVFHSKSKLSSSDHLLHSRTAVCIEHFNGYFRFTSHTSHFTTKLFLFSRAMI